MTIRNMQHLFAPQSIAIIGASNKLHSVGETVLRHLVEGGFGGAILPVNPKYQTLAGRTTYRSVASLPVTPDLALICTPPATVPGVISELGARGTKAAIVMTAGLDLIKDRHGYSLVQAMLDAAKPYLLRILGPDSVGLLVPGMGLHACLAAHGALPGQLAFVSQSGALGCGVLDWAKSHGIGFSTFISLGSSADVDIGDVLDYLAGDADTRAILLCIEDVRHARKFMSAARAAARCKPTLIVRMGSAFDAASVSIAPIGAQVGVDEVYDAAIRRAGMLRVMSMEDMFGAVETLARAHPLYGERLTVLTNGHGPGLMAADALIHGPGKLATLSDATMQKLDDISANGRTQANPVDIASAALPERYVKTMEVLLQDPQSDVILLIHAPTAMVSSVDIATALAPLVQKAQRNIFACWLGGDTVAQARHIFSSEAGIPSFDTPEEAVHSFMQIVQYRRNQNLLMQVPPSVSNDFQIDRSTAQEVVERALAAGRQVLSEPEAKRVLTAYGIPVVEPHLATTMQAMALKPHAYELYVGVITDPVFGPVIVFGQGGAKADVTADHTVGLPPLNAVLARDMVSHTRIFKLLAGYCNHPSADMDAICRTLIQVSHLVTDIPEIVALDINPLLADSDGVIAFSAHVCVALRNTSAGKFDHLAIRPYPDELMQEIAWQGMTLRLRPVKPEDGQAHIQFFNALDPEDIRDRMFTGMRELPLSQLARFTQIDYDREMAFIATRQQANGEWETLGVARVIADPDNIQAEFAIIVRSDLKGKGLGHLLMSTLIDYCRSHGSREIVGEAFSHNSNLLNMVKKLGFDVKPTPEGDIMQLHLALE